MSDSAVIADPERLDWEGWPDEQVAARGEVRWKTLFDAGVNGTAGLSAGAARLLPGEELSEHSHPQHEVYFVTAGTATVTVDGGRHEIGAGQSVFIRGGARHSCRNEGTEEARFVFCFAADSTAEVDYDF